LHYILYSGLIIFVVLWALITVRIGVLDFSDDTYSRGTRIADMVAAAVFSGAIACAVMFWQVVLYVIRIYS
jgi:hypothetical protein